MSQKDSLMLRKKMGGNQHSANFPLGFAPENGPHQVSSFLWETQEKALFRGTWWGPFSGAKQSGKLPERRRLQKIESFLVANSHSFAKIRLQMPTLMAQLPHISRHPSRSELCQVVLFGTLPPGDNSERCGIFWLGWLMDVGRYEGVAPSMWAFPA